MQGLRTDILPQPLEALAEKAPVRDVACGLGHALFLLSSGRICAWGNGGNGRLGLGDTSDRAEACLIKGIIIIYLFILFLFFKLIFTFIILHRSCK